MFEFFRLIPSKFREAARLEMEEREAQFRAAQAVEQRFAAAADEAQKKLEETTKRLATLEAENRLMLEELRKLRLLKFGPKGEKLTDAQQKMLELEPAVCAEEVAAEAERTEEEKEAIAQAVAPTAAKPPRRKPVRKGFPAHLPRVEQTIACTPEQCRCAQCGGETQVIGYESSEELDCKPAEYFVKVTRREKRACKGCEEMGVKTAPLPAEKIIPKGKASNAVVVDVLIGKFADHLPLYRQSVIFERDLGLDLSRATLCGWTMKAGDDLMAITRTMREELLAGDYIQTDETPVAVQSDEVKGRNHQGYFWEYSCPGGNVIFEFVMGRGREGPRKFLGSFAGILQSDGYGAYDKIGGEGITHAGCWAHVRRGFVQAAQVAENDPCALAIVQKINELYAIERTAREGQLDASARRALRQQKSAPLLPAIKALIENARRKALPKSALGKACDYALGQWKRLEVYLRHGQVEIDQNWCENAIRPIALGRKNWLHVGSEAAGPRVAAIISVIETCRRIGVNPREYLLDVLPRLAETITPVLPSLTPRAWAAARAKTAA